MLVLLIVEPKCTLATSHAAPGSQGEYADGQIPDITLSAMDAAIVISRK